MDLKREFNTLEKYYKENDFEKIISHELGIYYLKLLSISRIKILRELAEKLEFDISEIAGKYIFEFVFCKKISNSDLDDFVKQKYKIERQKRIENEDYLYAQLYKLRFFDWGGFYQNAVEQTIVNNYVKKIQDYERLCSKIENDINPRLRGYVLCSWYNHWTSILIEDMFKDHTRVLPAVGLVKKVDFFWQEFPFDLKVTYFPNEYIEKKRNELGLRPEFTELKKFAKKNNIFYDKKAKDKEIFSDLLTKISEDTSGAAVTFLEDLYKTRKKIILDTVRTPHDLIRWFYERQGTRRFDAASRFFLVLVDLDNLEDSWKLKRNKKLLKEKIHEFLDNKEKIDLEKLKLFFKWEDKPYITQAAILFILKEHNRAISYSYPP